MSRIIKASDDRAKADRFEPFSFRDVQSEADEIIARARRDAAAVLAAARQQAEVLRREARDEGARSGREQGLAEGRRTGRAEALVAATKEFNERRETLVATLNHALEQVDREKRRLLAAAYADLIDLALAIVQRVVGRAGEMNRQVAVENARRVIDLVGRRSDMILEVSPVDFDAVQTFAAGLLAEPGAREHVQILPEPSITPGGARCRAGDARVDATIEAQVEQIARVLLPNREESA